MIALDPMEATLLLLAIMLAAGAGAYLGSMIAGVAREAPPRLTIDSDEPLGSKDAGDRP